MSLGIIILAAAEAAADAEIVAKKEADEAAAAQVAADATVEAARVAKEENDTAEAERLANEAEEARLKAEQEAVEAVAAAAAAAEAEAARVQAEETAAREKSEAEAAEAEAAAATASEAEAAVESLVDVLDNKEGERGESEDLKDSEDSGFATEKNVRAQEATMLTPEGRAELKELFNHLDKDGDGKVSYKEWMRGLRGTQALLSKYYGDVDAKDVGAVFRRLDGDKSGTLTWDEFEAGTKPADKCAIQATEEVVYVLETLKQLQSEICHNMSYMEILRLLRREVRFNMTFMEILRQLQGQVYENIKFADDVQDERTEIMDEFLARSPFAHIIHRFYLRDLILVWHRRTKFQHITKKLYSILTPKKLPPVALIRVWRANTSQSQAQEVLHRMHRKIAMSLLLRCIHGAHCKGALNMWHSSYRKATVMPRYCLYTLDYVHSSIIVLIVFVV